MADTFNSRLNDLHLLHPHCRGRFLKLANGLQAGYVAGESKTLFLPFETLRLPQRQETLKAAGGSTKAGAWESTHQYGLACDFVPYDPGTGKWSWDLSHDWDFLDAEAARAGLVRPIRWDRPHIEHPKASYLLNEFKVLLSAPIKAAGLLVGYEPNHVG